MSYTRNIDYGGERNIQFLIGFVHLACNYVKLLGLQDFIKEPVTELSSEEMVGLNTMK